VPCARSMRNVKAVEEEEEEEGAGLHGRFVDSLMLHKKLLRDGSAFLINTSYART